jgi:hypothetical protein
MALRKSMPISELKQSKKDTAKHATEHQASRGGAFPVKDKPVPGTPKEEQDS